MPVPTVECDEVMLVAGRLVLLWRCPWCRERQETAVVPPPRGTPHPVDATCRACQRIFRVGPPGAGFAR